MEEYKGFKYQKLDNHEIEIMDYIGDDSEVTIPSYIDGCPVVSIAYNGFNESKIKKIHFPDTLQVINDWAFMNCIHLVDIDFGHSLEKLGAAVFVGCTNLSKVVLPSSLKSIGSYIFYNCDHLQSIIIDNDYFKSIDGVLYSQDLTKLMKYPSDCDLKSYRVFDGVEEIMAGAFAYSKCEEIVLPQSLKKIHHSAFAFCENLKSMNIPESVLYIGARAFSHCLYLEKVVLPHNLKQLEGGLFENCGQLRSIEIPRSVKKILPCVFKHCTSLSQLDIPKNVDLIGEQAFQGTGLKRIVIPQHVQYIDLSVFEDCKQLEEVVLPDRLTYIAVIAFRGCTSLKTIILPKYLETIDEKAFKECSTLTSITLPKTLKRIEDNAFDKCDLMFKVYDRSLGLEFVQKNNLSYEIIE